MENKTSKILPVYIRNFVFGVEDGLVSTVGFLVGVAVAGADKSYLILSGVVLIFVEAFSMGMGSFLSESSSTNLDANQDFGYKSLKGGLIMFVSYLAAGFLVLSPYFFSDGIKGIMFSVGISIIALMALGYVSAKLTGSKIMKRIVRTVIVGSLAIALGVVIGIFIKNNS